MLKGKYLKYKPEITFEIFQKIWNKLIENGWTSSGDFTVNSEYNNFQNDYPILRKGSYGNSFGVYDDICQLEEITVEEILGYNPFEFILPKKWCVERTDENAQVFCDYYNKTIGNNIWIPSMIKHNKWIVPMLDNIASTPKNDGYIEITFDQFKQYVLKETVEVKPLFEVGRWYKCNNPYYDGTSYVKCKHIDDYFHFSEVISCKKHRVYDGNWYLSYNYQLLADLSEIQQYLPEGHVDKISVVPEYVECISLKGGASNLNIGDVIKTESDGCILGVCIYNSNTYKTCFKPSTKEAYDAQFKPKLIEKWSVGSYIVSKINSLHNISKCKVGDIFIIKSVDTMNFIDERNNINWSFDTHNESEWFATLQEAEEFSKLLLKHKENDYSKFIGKWWKRDKTPKFLCFVECETNRYGFDSYGDWFNIHDKLIDAGFIEATKEEVEKTLLDYTKEKYPIGTKYIPCEVKDVFSLGDSEVALKLPKINSFNCIEVGFGYVLYKGEWAEIIEPDDVYEENPCKEPCKIVMPSNSVKMTSSNLMSAITNIIEKKQSTIDKTLEIYKQLLNN